MSVFFSKTSHKHLSSVHESETPIGKELKDLGFRERAKGGDFGGSHVDAPYHHLREEEDEKDNAALSHAAPRVSSKPLAQGELKTPNLLRKIPHHHHSHHPDLSEAQIAIAERHPHTKRIREHHHPSHSKKSFQFSWWTPFAAVYRVAQRICHFFSNNKSSTTSSSTRKKAVTANFTKPLQSYGSSRREQPVSEKDTMEERRLKLIDDLNNEKSALDIYRLNEAHNKSLQGELRRDTSPTRLSLTLDEYMT